jgi:hypothetical protein
MEVVKIKAGFRATVENEKRALTSLKKRCMRPHRQMIVIIHVTSIKSTETHRIAPKLATKKGLTLSVWSNEKRALRRNLIVQLTTGRGRCARGEVDKEKEKANKCHKFNEFGTNDNSIFSLQSTLLEVHTASNGRSRR